MGLPAEATRSRTRKFCPLKPGSPRLVQSHVPALRAYLVSHGRGGGAVCMVLPVPPDCLHAGDGTGEPDDAGRIAGEDIAEIMDPEIEAAQSDQEHEHPLSHDDPHPPAPGADPRPEEIAQE